jgi:hypothetical protein
VVVVFEARCSFSPQSRFGPRRPGPATPSNVGRNLIRAGLVAALATGCGDGGSRVPTQPEVLPTASSPPAAARLLEWGWNQRRLDVYSGMVSADFVFQFGALDPYGSAYRTVPWTRDDELISLDHLFHGGGGKQAAGDIRLALDRNLTVVVDPRPGKDPRWHKAIRSYLFLSVIDASQVRTDVTGFGLFFLVRGDSAAVPQEMLDAGYAPDSTRWFLERWEDESAGAPGGQTMPARMITVGQIKALYR